MEDKDVGELWRDHIEHCDPPDNLCNEIKLIRKLVEERKKFNRACLLHEAEDPEHANDDAFMSRQALWELGIDPATYPGGEK